MSVVSGVRNTELSNHLSPGLWAPPSLLLSKPVHLELGSYRLCKPKKSGQRDASKFEMATHSRSQRARFAQEASERKISDLEKELEALCAKKISTGGNELDAEIQKLAVELKRERQALKRKIQNAENQKKFRDSKKMKLNQLCNENPEIKRKLAIRDAIGRPSLHQDQPELMKAIADIAMSGSAPDANGDFIQTKRTLEELTAELNRLGFNISRSATYLRLLPRNASTTEGARHVNTVPVKLSRAQDSHRPHPDRQFAAASIRYLETIATILGPSQTFYLSQFDKARVPLGLAAADEQAPLLMHMDYRSMLPDRDWMEAERRKLIPSVYAGIIIEKWKIGQSEAVTSSGPTYVAIRSGQQGSPTANMHLQDLRRLLNLEEFWSVAKTKDGLVNPVMIIIVDGGPDESPRYEKVIAAAVQIFKENDLDALFIATNAPDTKYNRVERRMAPLSREVGGLIIPHDHFLGSLLDAHTPEIEDMESKFEAAGKILAEVWSSMTVDGHPVRASYLDQGEMEEKAELLDGKWYAHHVRESQYLLQITKCKEIACCRGVRSGVFQILRDRFMPPPIKVLQTESKLVASEKGDFLDLLARLSLDIDIQGHGSSSIPYDYTCPSVKSLLQSRTCTSCGLYHASTRSLARHMKSVHPDVDTQPSDLVKPSRISAKRDNEILCILTNEDGYSDAEWRENNEVDESGHVNEESSTESDKNNLMHNVDNWVRSARPEST